MASDGASARVQRIAQRIAFPAWTPRYEIACVATDGGRARVTIPCGGAAIHTDPDLDVYGPIAFAPDGATVYVAFANPSGMVDLWAAPVGGGRARRLTAFSRDTYAPSVTTGGAVLFKVQSYRTVVAVAPAEGGASQPLATFQSETPSWDPAGRSIGITYGTWRRVVDDAHYPDIAQEAGIIGVDPEHPAPRSRASSTPRCPRTSRCAGRRTANGSRFTLTRINPTTSGCGPRPRPPVNRSRAGSVFSAAARKPAGRAGRPTASGCCSTAPAVRRTGR